jgi:hypothetical protein
MGRDSIRTKVLVANRQPKHDHGTMAQRRAIGATAIAISVVVIALVVVLGFTTMSPQSVTQTATTTPTQQTSTVASQSNSAGTVTTTTADSTTSFAYLSADGGCAAGGKAAPCWGSPAYVFDCLSAAQTQQGCTQLVSTTTPNWNFTINIRYPFSNQTAPSWANCLWSMQGAVPGQGFGHCSPVNSTSFSIGEPAPARQ